MSLIHMKGVMTRRRAGIVLCAIVPALPSVAAAATPQATTTTSTSAPRARSRAQGIAGAADSTRAKRILLSAKLDSLRTVYEHRRMTDEEREAVAKQLTSTVEALAELIDASVRGGFDEMRVEGFAGAGMRRSREPDRVMVTVQTGAKRGYLGVTFDGPMLSDRERDSVRFFANPLIASVDPSSPAERAGVQRGDTLVALNGTEVIDHVFSFTKLLVPDEKITLRIRRDGDAKEFRVVVGEAPSYVVQRMPAWAPIAPVEPGEVRVRTVPPPGSARTPRAAPIPAEPPEMTFEYAYPTRGVFVTAVVGGTRLEPLSEGLAKNLGVKGGLLVGRVMPGTPSDQWGFREGDIILTADGETMLVVQDFTVLIADRNRASDGVKVVVLRDKKRQDLILKP